MLPDVGVLLVSLQKEKVSLAVLIQQHHAILTGFAHCGLVLVNIPDHFTTTVASEFFSRRHIVLTLQVLHHVDIRKTFVVSHRIWALPRFLIFGMVIFSSAQNYEGMQCFSIYVHL